MDQHEEFLEEVTDEEVKVVPPAPVAVVAPLNVEVPEIPDNPESPSPQPSLVSSGGSSPVAAGGPSPVSSGRSSPVAAGGPSPVALPPGSPVGGATSFMGFYTLADLTELEQWTVESRAARANPNSRIEEPDVSPNLKIFLRYEYGTQWEVRLIRASGEVLIDQLKAFLAGYNQLTSFNRRQWLRLFPAWTAQEGGISWGHSPTRAASGKSRASSPPWGRRSFSANGPFLLSCARLCGKKIGFA